MHFLIRFKLLLSKHTKMHTHCVCKWIYSGGWPKWKMVVKLHKSGLQKVYLQDLRVRTTYSICSNFCFVNQNVELDHPQCLTSYKKEEEFYDFVKRNWRCFLMKLTVQIIAQKWIKLLRFVNFLFSTKCIWVGW